MEHNEYVQLLMDSALEIIIVFNQDGMIKYANGTAKRLLEYEDLIIKCFISDILPGECRIEEDKLFFDNEAVSDVSDMMAYRKNRTCFPVKGKITHFQEGNSYIFTAIDVSRESFLEKTANQGKQEAELVLKVKSEFVANVTHELRTPVNGILGNTKELIGLEQNKDKLDLLRLVERGCQDMNSIIDNILDFSKLEAGKFVLETRRFHFRTMIDYVRRNHSNRIIEKGLDFTVSVSSEIPEEIVGDELRIVQVLNNLISNAYKFTSVGGVHIDVVKTAQSGNRIQLFFMVIDTGIGIDKSEQDKLFKSFSQVDASISRKYGGTGLGLNICKQLVELMGGSIHVESDRGKGSMFSFDLWAELVEEEGSESVPTIEESIDSQPLMEKLMNLSQNRVNEKVWQYGAAENKDELNKKMSKLILSVEMENWEKAETFAETVKQLLDDAPREIKSGALKLKMAVQRGDYDKTIAAYENLQNMI